jgi:collagenase-like PrtC family protease
VLLALNTYPQASNPAPWRSALDRAAAWGVDAIILADPGLMRYACERHPGLRLHLSVQGSATNHDAINLYHRQFNIQRAVLPRVLSLDAGQAGGAAHRRWRSRCSASAACA